MVQEITKIEIEGQDQLWKYQHFDFEQKIKGIEWEFLSNKYIHTWDGNHRLAAWTKVIKGGDHYHWVDVIIIPIIITKVLFFYYFR